MHEVTRLQCECLHGQISGATQATYVWQELAAGAPQVLLYLQIIRCDARFRMPKEVIIETLSLVDVPEVGHKVVVPPSTSVDSALS